MSSEAVCQTRFFSPWLGVNVEVDAHHLALAIQNPDAVQVALQLGRLDLVAVLLGCIAVVLAIAASVSFGWISVRSRQIADRESRRTAIDFMRGEEGRRAIEMALRNPEVAAYLQDAMQAAGLFESRYSGAFDRSVD